MTLENGRRYIILLHNTPCPELIQALNDLPTEGVEGITGIHIMMIEWGDYVNNPDNYLTILIDPRVDLIITEIDTLSPYQDDTMFGHFALVVDLNNPDSTGFSLACLRAFWNNHFTNDNRS